MPAPLSRRRFLSLATTATAGAVLSACGDGSTAAPAPSAQAPDGALAGETVSMSVYAKNHASSPLYWQQFAPEGLSVDVQVFTNPSDMNRALQAGDLDFALMGVYNTLVEAEQGFTSKIIGMVSREGMGLIARTDRGIETVADLAGKTVAVPPPGVQVLVLTELLAAEGLELDRDLRSVPLGYADHAAALAQGDVDAYIGTEPPCTTSVVDGVGQRLGDVYATPLGDFNTALWASPAMLERPELCQAAVDMQRAAAEYLTPGGENDPEVWRELLVDQFEYAVPVYEEVLSNIGAVWDFDDERRAQLEAAGRIMAATGILPGEPDYDALVDLRYLR